ncbi:MULTISPECIES: hypothetical protein [unclassified Microbacterium]|uniref:hypothetical protein n=1 Tax=unclassified Microbacterium TaxID=2609290 RepID=UPI003656B0F7
MTRRLVLIVVDADAVVGMLPDVGLSGVRMPDDEEGRQRVQVVPYFESEEPEDLWFELAWHADKLGIIHGGPVEVEDAPPAGEMQP